MFLRRLGLIKSLSKSKNDHFAINFLSVRNQNSSAKLKSKTETNSTEFESTLENVESEDSFSLSQSRPKIPLENDPEALQKIKNLKEKLQRQKSEIESQQQSSDPDYVKKIIEKRLDDYIPPLNIEDDSADGLFDEEHLDVVNVYLKKVYGDHELFLKDLELGYIENYKQRTFYKLVKLFKEETGETKRGYIEFSSALLYNLKKFDVEKHPQAYRELLECFPQSPYTGIRRSNTGKFNGAMWQERYADHELATLILREMYDQGLHGDNSLREYVLQIWGRNSQPYVMVDNMMYWNPRFAGFNMRYDYNAYVTPYAPPNVLKDPVEASFKALRQMCPGIYTDMNRYPINENLELQLQEMQKRNEIEIKSEKLSPYEAKQKREMMDRKAFANAIISAQTDDMVKKIGDHEENVPIILSGPHVVYVQGKRIKYYSIESAVGGDFDMTVYEDPDQYKKIEYAKWWRGEEDIDRVLWNTESDLGRINAIKQKVLPSTSHLKGQVEGDLLWEGHSQLGEIDEFEETWESPTYAVATFGSDGTEIALLQWIKNLSLTHRENYEAFSKAPVIFKKSMLPSEEINIDPTFESTSLINYENCPAECFLGTANDIMPHQKEMDKMMTGVDIDYDYEERVKWGDGVNALFFDEWSYYVPSKKHEDIGDQYL